MRKLAVAFMGITLCLAASAQAEISSTVTVTSEYVLRGVSQTNEEAAIQGSIDYSHSGGFYIGTWGSNVDFGTAAQVELDLYTGWAWETQGGLGLDVGIIHYDYPGETALNYEEYYLGLSYKWLSVTYYFADDFLGLGGVGHYLDSGLEFELPHAFTLGVHAGFNSFDDDVGIEDYVDYKASIAKAFGKLSLEVAYTDTDENQLGNLDDERVVVSLSVSQ